MTTPAGALALIRAYLGRLGGFLRPETLRAAIEDQTGGVGGGCAVLAEPASGVAWSLHGSRTAADPRFDAAMPTPNAVVLGQRPEV